MNAIVKEFELIPVIASELSMFSEVYFDEELKVYLSSEDNHHLHAIAKWLNGAYYMYEMQWDEVATIKAQLNRNEGY